MTKNNGGGGGTARTGEEAASILNGGGDSSEKPTVDLPPGAAAAAPAESKPAAASTESKPPAAASASAESKPAAAAAASPRGEPTPKDARGEPTSKDVPGDPTYAEALAYLNRTLPDGDFTVKASTTVNRRTGRCSVVYSLHHASAPQGPVTGTLADICRRAAKRGAPAVGAVNEKDRLGEGLAVASVPPQTETGGAPLPKSTGQKQRDGGGGEWNRGGKK